MCGLFGYVTTKPKKKYADASKALGVMMQDRGSQSTGIAMLRNEDIDIVKKATSAVNFFDRDMVIGEGTRAILGHTRYATQGAVNDKNAHPFQYGHYTGCHNGVIWNDHEFGKFEVDSEVIFYLLDKFSGDFHRTFKQLRGSMAVSWTNGRNVYLVRHENPLSVAKLDDAVFWASEEKALQAVMRAIGEPEPDIFSLRENIVYAFDKNLNQRKIPTKFKSFESYVSKWNSKTGKWEDKKDDGMGKPVQGWSNWKKEDRGEWDPYLVPKEGTNLLKEPETYDVNIPLDVQEYIEQLADIDDFNKLTEVDKMDNIIAFAREISYYVGCVTCEKIISPNERFYTNVLNAECCHMGTCFEEAIKKHRRAEWELIAD